MSDPREALARVISDHQLTGRISIGCTGCLGLEFMTSVEHAAHVADMIAMQFLVVPQNEIVGVEYGYRYSDEDLACLTENREDAIEGARQTLAWQRDAMNQLSAEVVARPSLPWSVIPLPADGEQP